MNPTIIRLGLRSVFGRRRGILLFILPLVLIGLAVLVRVLVGADQDSAEDTLDRLGLAVIVPLIALLATTGLLAPEIDDGSISYLLAKPISRHSIVASKLAVAAGCVLVFAVLPMLVAGLVLLMDTPGLALGFAVGSLVGGVAYCALFALAVGDDQARGRDRPDLPADLGGPPRRAARRRALAEHHPVGTRDHRVGRRHHRAGRPARHDVRRHRQRGRDRARHLVTGRRLRAFNLTGDE